jgi:hypothetical protein
VNGGTFARIYGGGNSGSEVTGTAKTVIDGRVNDETVQPVSEKCSVTISDVNNVAKNTYAFGESGNDNYEDISGGSVGNGRVAGSKGTVGSTDLTIRYLNYEGEQKYNVAPNGGDVTGDVSITVENSNIKRIQRGPSDVFGDWTFTVKDSTANIDLHQLYDHNSGVADGKKMTVYCDHSTILWKI